MIRKRDVLPGRMSQRSLWLTCRLLLLAIGLSVAGQCVHGTLAFAQTPNDAPCPHSGDVNGDGTPTPADVLMTFLHFTNNRLFPLETCLQSRANVMAPTTTGITPADARCIMRRFLGVPSCLDPQETPAAMAAASMNTLFTVLTAGVRDLVTRRSAPQSEEMAITVLPAQTLQEIPVNCPEGGTATVSVEVTGTSNNITLDGSVTLNDCNGLAGVLTFSGQVTVDREAFSATLALDGSVGEGVCSVTVNAVTLQIDADASMATGTVSGMVTVACGPVTTVSCSWQAVALMDEDALIAGCN